MINFRMKIYTSHDFGYLHDIQLSDFHTEVPKHPARRTSRR